MYDWCSYLELRKILFFRNALRKAMVDLAILGINYLSVFTRL